MSSRRIIYSDKTIDDFTPPDLLAPSAPEQTSLGNQSTQATYQSLIEGRRQVETAEGEARFRKALLEYPDVAKAMFSVMLESRKIIANTTDNDNNGDHSKSATNEITGIVEPPPMRMSSVQLPVNCKSWLGSKTHNDQNHQVGEDAATTGASSKSNNNNQAGGGGGFPATAPKCYNCNQPGHISRNCPYRR